MSSKKALPRYIDVACSRCETRCRLPLVDDEREIDQLLARQLIFGGKKPLRKKVEDYAKEMLEAEGDCQGDRAHDVQINVSQEAVDYRIIYIRDPPLEMDKFEERVYQTTTAYAIGQPLPDPKKVKIRATVTTDPKNNIVLMVHAIEPVEEDFMGFKITEQEKEDFIRYFQSAKTLHRKIAPSQIAPRIVGREWEKLGVLLTLHSPMLIPDVTGDTIRGGIKAMFIGDTTTGKTEMLKDVSFGCYNLGEYNACESTSRTGLTYTIDTDHDVLKWGSLVLNDMGMVCLDGMQDLPSRREMDKLTEALRTQRVVVRRYLQGEAPARTRILGSMNPPKGRPMKKYPFPCLVISGTAIFRSEKNIPRWDLFIPMKDEDVSVDDIITETPPERYVPVDVFKQHVHWVWSRTPDDIEYVEGAIDLIKSETTALIKTYKTARLPIVHNGYRDTVCRFSVATAALLHSTDEEHQKIMVSEKHVRLATDYIRRMLDKLGLKEYRQLVEEETELYDGELLVIIDRVDAIDLSILLQLSIGDHTSTELAEEVGIKPETIRGIHFRALRNLKLITTQPGKGASLTPKGAAFVEWVYEWKHVKTRLTHGGSS
ncbi:MAG: hypothetical protein ACP5FL_03915 [Thermoplasmatota archaeon]